MNKLNKIIFAQNTYSICTLRLHTFQTANQLTPEIHSTNNYNYRGKHTGLSYGIVDFSDILIMPDDPLTVPHRSTSTFLRAYGSFVPVCRWHRVSRPIPFVSCFLLSGHASISARRDCLDRLDVRAVPMANRTRLFVSRSARGQTYGLSAGPECRAREERFFWGIDTRV